MRRLATAVAVAGLVTLLEAGAAAADPAVPGDYRSTVDAIEPAADAVHAEVVGGDAFLALTVDAGHEVVVAGYQGEPYLRFRPDGTVQRNRRSPATYANERRDGATDVPSTADAGAEPEWATVADGGTYAWHDHRIHWMGSGRPDGAVPGEWTRGWAVEIRVDGTATRITGTLALAHSVSPVPWMAIGLTGVGAVLIAGRRRPLVAGALAAPAASAVALGVGWAQRADAPAVAPASPLLVLMPAVGVALGVLGLALVSAGGRRNAHVPQPVTAAAPTESGDGGWVRAIVATARAGARTIAVAATLGSATAVMGWGLLRLAVLTKPVIPTALDPGLDRAATVLALGMAVAAAGLVVWSGGSATPHEDEAEVGTAVTVGGGRRR
jgi:hypothetical protein